MEGYKKIMRIISGKFKGKKISFVNSTNTRPLRDYVKENIFNIIDHGKKTKINLQKFTIQYIHTIIIIMRIK